MRCRKKASIRRVVFTVFLGLMSLLLLAASDPAQGFNDVPPSHPYSIAINDMAERGVITGYADGRFGPSDLVTRQQFAKMAVKTLDLPVTGNETCPFVDVSGPTGSDPFYPAKYIAVCAQYNITKGKDATHFAPYDNITRQQVITMVVRAAGAALLAPPPGWAGDFSYSDPTHGESIRRAEYNGLLLDIDGSGAQWVTSKNATRAECAHVLHNLLAVLSDTGESPTGDTGVVSQVVDGDTIAVQIGGTSKTVRLIGIDAPETGQPFAAEAKAALNQMVRGKTVRIELDVEEIDQYGRTLAYVWIGHTMVNEEMLRQGLATLYTVPPNVKYAGVLQTAQDKAEAAGRGIWGSSTGSPVKIVSVRYDAPGNDNNNLNEEYITFQVLVSGSLVGYAVQDESGKTYYFPDRIYQKGQTFRLHSGRGTDTQTDLYWGMTGTAVWNNDGDTVKVLDPQGKIVESYSY